MPNLQNPLPMASLPQTAAQAVGPIKVADALGVASIALGAPMLLSSRRLLRAIGVEPDGKAVALTLLVGLREFVAAGTILAMRHRRVGAWSRVGGDTMDILMVTRCAGRRTDTARWAGALAALAGIFTADLFTALALDRAEGVRVEEGAGSHGAGMPADLAEGVRTSTALTILGSEDEVRRAFGDFPWSALDPQAANPRFVAAPGDRGTELHVEHGGDPRASDELRRFKALLETGVEVRSDKTPEGVSSLRQLLQRPAHPQEVTA